MNTAPGWPAPDLSPDDARSRVSATPPVVPKSNFTPRAAARKIARELRVPRQRVDEPNAIIFVVDDDESVRKSLRRLLRSAGFGVETFASGAQFLARTPRARDGVVILDLRMPSQNGLEIQRELRDRGTPMRVIFITAHDDDEARATAMARGAVGFVRKPFDQAVLLELVEQAVSQQTQAASGAPRTRGAAQ